MGKKILEMYDEAKKIGGFNAQMRLAILTKIPSTKAMEILDTGDIIKTFKDAMAIVKKELNKN